MPCSFFGVSRPFLLFKLPFMTSLLTHAKPTGYRRDGVLLPCGLDLEDVVEPATSSEKEP